MSGSNLIFETTAVLSDILVKESRVTGNGLPVGAFPKRSVTSMEMTPLTESMSRMLTTIGLWN